MVSLVIEGREIPKGEREVHISFSCQYQGREIIVSCDDCQPFYAAIKHSLLPKLVSEYKLDRIEAIMLINKGLAACGLVELKVPTAVKVC